MPRQRKAAPASDPAGSWSRNCGDCVPPLHVQGGDWGWRAHRHALHGEGEHPGPHPPPAQDRTPPPGWTPWNDAQRAEFHRRRMADRRRQRYAPRAARGPLPPRGMG